MGRSSGSSGGSCGSAMAAGGVWARGLPYRMPKPTLWVGILWDDFCPPASERRNGVAQKSLSRCAFDTRVTSQGGAACPRRSGRHLHVWRSGPRATVSRLELSPCSTLSHAERPCNAAAAQGRTGSARAGQMLPYLESSAGYGSSIACNRNQETGPQTVDPFSISVAASQCNEDGGSPMLHVVGTYGLW